MNWTSIKQAALEHVVCLLACLVVGLLGCLMVVVVPTIRMVKFEKRKWNGWKWLNSVCSFAHLVCYKLKAFRRVIAALLSLFFCFCVSKIATIVANQLKLDCDSSCGEIGGRSYLI